MRNSRVASRYAEALLDTASERGLLEAVLKDAELLRETAAHSPQLRAFLRNPVIKNEMKASILTTLFGKRIAEVTMDFLKLLVEKNREEFLLEIVDELFRLHDERSGIARLELKAARELSEKHLSAIIERFERITGKTIKMSFIVDAGLKGGLLARIGDTVYDGSVRRQLEMLREQFSRGVVSN